MLSDKPSINPGSLIGGCVNAENLRSDASFSAEKKEKWVTRARKGTRGRTDWAISSQEGPSRALPVLRGAVGCVLNLGGREEDQLQTNHVSQEEMSNGYRVLSVLGCACVSEMCDMSWIVDP